MAYQDGTILLCKMLLSLTEHVKWCFVLLESWSIPGKARLGSNVKTLTIPSLPEPGGWVGWAGPWPLSSLPGRFRLLDGPRPWAPSSLHCTQACPFLSLVTCTWLPPQLPVLCLAQRPHPQAHSPGCLVQQVPASGFCSWQVEAGTRGVPPRAALPSRC